MGQVRGRFFKYSRERYQVFEQTVAELGLEHDATWDTWAEVGDPEEPDWGRAIAVRQSRPDAIVALNDNRGLRMIESLRRHGVRVPDDIRVAALGDTIETVEATAQFTSIREPIREIGRAAARLVADAFRDPAVTPRERLITAAELVVRMSSGG